LDSIEDYSELLLQFGYTTLFITGLPAAAFLALWNNHYEIRGDAEKILYQTRRVCPKGAQDIGTWQVVFELISTVAVITNTAIVVFTMNIFDSYTVYFRFWLFIGAQWAIFSLQGVIRIATPDVPHEVLLQMERNSFIVSKLIDFAKDDDDDGEDDLKESYKRVHMSSMKIESEYSGPGAESGTVRGSVRVV